jgi:DNA-binding GntR family transcriptional regulator
MDENEIHHVLTRALLSGRVAAGTKLGEHRLAELLGVSRERIRKVLQRLGHERLVRIEKNRGAFAIEPDLGEARAIYEARRIVEGGIVAHLSGGLDGAGRARLDRHIEAEAEAMAAGDRVASIRLSAAFHTILAELTGNPIVIRQMQELVAQTVMLVAHFEPDGATTCQCQEHRAIHRAILAGEGGRAVRAMTSHLSLVETRLRPRLCEEAGETIEDVLQAALAERLDPEPLSPSAPYILTSS